ncbi:hypothetical protein B296_00031848 [Ensete ventricosum]|uniref:Uncharacterized protein n=1 Tax=Ensete ventricosum TaxID=4639 RepID=A0A426YMT7_ENSVE|nr:hypothetical protein B296_00031848 [Ensete ventricosum]
MVVAHCVKRVMRGVITATLCATAEKPASCFVPLDFGDDGHSNPLSLHSLDKTLRWPATTSSSRGGDDRHRRTKRSTRSSDPHRLDGVSYR